MTLIPNTKWEKQQKQGFQEKHDPFQRAVDQGTGKGYQFNDFSQDLFSSLYQINPRFPEEATPGTGWAKKALDELKELSEFKNIRESGTKCDSFQSGLGATVLTRHFADSLPKMKEKNPDEIQQEINDLESLLEDIPEGHEKANEFNGRLNKAQDSLQGAQSAWAEMAGDLDPSAIRQALRKGLIAAQEAIDEAEGTANAFGYGTEPGQDGYTSAQQKLAIAEKIRENPKLKQIAEMAGRFRREARKQQAQKKKPGPDELTDIECGNDLGRVVPSELMLLNDEVGEMVFFKKYLERGLIQYKLEEAPKEKRGPIVFCLDGSGSMAGLKEVFSKSIFLALAQLAIDQKRAIEIIHFSSEVKKVYEFPAGEINPEQLIEACLYFSGGGTNFNFPLKRAFNDIEQEAIKGLKKADVVLISDGIATLDGIICSYVSRMKEKTGASLYTILLGSHPSNELKEISTSIHTISDLLEKDCDKDAKETLFSI